MLQLPDDGNSCKHNDLKFKFLMRIVLVLGPFSAVSKKSNEDTRMQERLKNRDPRRLATTLATRHSSSQQPHDVLVRTS